MPLFQSLPGGIAAGTASESVHSVRQHYNIIANLISQDMQLFGAVFFALPESEICLVYQFVTGWSTTWKPREE